VKALTAPTKFVVNAASLQSEVISLDLVLLVCCSESSSVVWHAQAF